MLKFPILSAKRCSCGSIPMYVSFDSENYLVICQNCGKEGEKDKELENSVKKWNYERTSRKPKKAWYKSILGRGMRKG